jgi:hypothetical protein
MPKLKEMLRNTPKHHFGSDGVGRMLRNFGTLKWCIQARNTSFASFYMLKVSEMLRNTAKQHFGSNGVEWMIRNNGTLKQCIEARNTSFSSFYVPNVSEILRNTANIILGLMEKNVCFATSVPWNSAFGPETQVLHRFTCRRLAKCSESLPNIILGLME